MNKGGNAARLGLQNTGGKNPYTAPAGSIVVVRAGTPGTAHPTAGDIAVAGGGGKFWNGGDMGYGGSGNFPPGNSHVAGIFVPTKCSGGGGGGGGGGTCSSSCSKCVKGGGGKACASKCGGCPLACTLCVKGGGGKACAGKCQ